MMIKNYRIAAIITIVFACSNATAQDKSSIPEPMVLAKKHSLTYNKPAPDFFEGALLGNGAMGVVVTTRPDAIVLRFGHNNVWDIRIAENNREKLGTFQSVFDKVNKIPRDLSNLTDDPWYEQYNRMAGENYSKPYPRPFPCGSVLLGFDRRKLQLLGHELDISNGVCKVKLLTSDKKLLMLTLFTDLLEDKLWMELTDEKGNLQKNLFDRVKIMPDPSTPEEFPRPQITENIKTGILGFRQLLPYADFEKGTKDIGHAKDKAFSLTLATNQELYKKDRIAWNGNNENMEQLEAAVTGDLPFLACVSIKEGLSTDVPAVHIDQQQINPAAFKKSYANNLSIWKTYWNKSAVQLDDDFLEETWYRNLYFLNCATKAGVTTPGLFANWSYNKIGTAWHGDYHLNYNVQQPFWVTFSSNHLEKNLPYVDLIESLMPVSRKWAKEYYNLPGAYFPHSAYPVDMTMNPYPIPDWGWEVSETPWAVQGLWWHYLYSGDRSFLKTRAYEPIKAAVEFLVGYMTRPEARNRDRWKDGKFHIFPTVPPELYGLKPGFRYNYDSNVDLSLTKFAFNAFKDAVKILGTSTKEKHLLDQINKIQSAFPDYPTVISEKYGKVLVSVPEEHDKVVYNVPNALFTVFPGEDHGLNADKETFKMLQNTYKNQQNEGGNDLVFINLQAARIGMLDLEEFKRQISYCLLPNGTATDMVMQVGGRYDDRTEFNYMSKMGIWFENFALPAVINECLLQGYNGKIRLFPNWPKDKDASFNNLRTAGAFLVSATQRKGIVTDLKITSEKGNVLQVVLPWKKGYVITASGRKKITNSELRLKTSPGEQITFYAE
jgi:hypothetical protein